LGVPALSSGTGSKDERLLPGLNAAQLTVRGAACEAAAAACVVPIALQRVLPGGRLLWLAAGLTLGLALLAVGLYLTFRSFARTRAEKATGYTTLWKVAREDPSLAYLDGRDGTLISGPGQSRPRTGRRGDIQACKDRNSTWETTAPKDRRPGQDTGCP